MLERVTGSAGVLDLTPAEPMRIMDVADLERANEKLQASGESIRPGDILLLRTDWSQRQIGTQRYFEESPSLTEEAEVRRLRLLRSSRSPRPGWTADEFVVHAAILGAGIPLIEGLVNLRDLPKQPL